jgi:zinc transport system ATP-binding protein
MNKEIAVRFDSVSFSYTDLTANKVQVLEDASFHIHRREFVAMVGPNGSGKTTVLKLLFGLEKPSSGKIEIFDANLAYVSQLMPADNLFPITVRDIVRMGLLRPFKAYSRNSRQEAAAVTEALEKTGIGDLAAKPYNSLSGGQKRRTLVARALAARPQLLVLDEPTVNMDNESVLRLYEALGVCKETMTILIVTHDTEFVTSLTDRVLCLGDSRKIVQHRTETNVSAGHRHHGGLSQELRVLHGEDDPNHECCG